MFNHRTTKENAFTETKMDSLECEEEIKCAWVGGQVVRVLCALRKGKTMKLQRQAKERTNKRMNEWMDEQTDEEMYENGR